MRTLNFLLLLTACICFSFPLGAQPEKVSKKDLFAELEMTHYAPDSTAPAVFLSNRAETNIAFEFPPRRGNNIFVVYLDRYFRIKVLNRQGFDYAQVEIPLYHRGSYSEDLYKMTAVVYNLENGRIVSTKLQKADIFREKVTPHLTKVKFTLPEIQIGSVIEVYYQVASDFFFQPPKFEFQQDIPVAKTHYKFQTSEYLNFNMQMRGYELSRLQLLERAARDVEGVDRNPVLRYTWEGKHLPGFKEEPYMLAPQDYLTRIEFELASITHPEFRHFILSNTWNDVANKLLQDDQFGGILNINRSLKRTAQTMAGHLSDPAEITKAIYEYVTSNFRWNEYYSFYADEQRSFPEQGQGNSADINLRLVALLRAAGVSADPLLLSTRHHGSVVQSFVSSQQFNHVIAVVNLGEKRVLLDATDPNVPLGFLPANCLNSQGLVVKAGQPEWIPLNDKAQHSVTAFARLTLTGEEMLKGTLKYRLKDYAALEFLQLKKGGDQEVRPDGKTHPLAVTLKDWREGTLQGQGGKVQMNQTFESTDHLMDGGDLLYLNPMLDFAIEENPFKLEERNFPVDIGYAINREFILQLEVPEGYTIEALPESLPIALPQRAGTFQFSTSVIGNKIQVRSRLSLDQPWFLPQYYPALRKFFDLIVEKHQEPIVLRRG